MSNSLNDLSVIATLVISLISLFVAVAALKISRAVYIYSAKDYLPQIIYSINDKDELKLQNKSKKLFTIRSVNFLKIITVGFEDHESKSVIQIPFITISTVYWWINKTQKISIGIDEQGACAYNICPYDSGMVKSVIDKIQLDYSLGSEKGYAFPSFQSVKFVVEIIYDNKFQERKSLIFCKRHIHGHGYNESRMSQEELSDILGKSQIPKFESKIDLWDYLIRTYAIPSDKFY